MRLPPSINPKAFTFVAFIIGYALIDDLTANEQNSIGNWLMLIGQVLETNASQQQVIEERKNTDNTNDSSNTNNENISKDDLNLIKNAINKMQQEINKLM